MQDRPDQPTLSMANRSNGLIMSQARNRAAIDNFEDASVGPGCSVGTLVENSPGQNDRMQPRGNKTSQAEKYSVTSYFEINAALSRDRLLLRVVVPVVQKYFFIIGSGCGVADYHASVAVAQDTFS